MNDYETRRLQKIKHNQALLAELDIKPVVSSRKTPDDGSNRPPAKKKRRLNREEAPAAPSRSSARIAAAETKPSYNQDEAVDVSRSTTAGRSKKSIRQGGGTQELGSKLLAEPEPLIPSRNIEEIQAGWTAWEAVGATPTRDERTAAFRFPDYPHFTPNKSPAEVIREGCFGGSYYRPLRSRKLGIVVKGDWRDLPADWIEGLEVGRFLTSAEYDPEVNKFKVACGQSIEEWEAAGWIDHAHDVRGWFQWYTRFFRGRRCEDDERQVGRWRKCVGETGRWRRMLLKKYVALGVREVFDDGAEEEAPEVSPVMHQTCHHWAFEVRQQHLDEVWGRGG